MMSTLTTQPATWSAKRWIGARDRWACATICTIWESKQYVAPDFFGLQPPD